MKRKLFAALCLLCVAAGCAHWADLLLFTDVTGLPQAGGWWMHYLPALIPAAALLLSGGGMKGKVKAEVCSGTAFGWFCLLAGLFWLLAGAAGLVRMLLSLGNGVADVALSVLACAGGVWHSLLGISRMRGEQNPPTGSIAVGVLGTLVFYLLTILRFMEHQSSLVWVGFTLNLFSALILLRFSSAVVRAVYLPESIGNRRLFAAGMGAFLLCTCLELPRTLVGVWNGTLGKLELLQSLGIAALGITGLLCAVKIAENR